MRATTFLCIVLMMLITPLHAAAEGKGTESPTHPGLKYAPSSSQATKQSWTTLPILTITTSGSSRASRVVNVVPHNITVTNVDGYSNNLEDKHSHRQLSVADAVARLDQPATGGFHMLTARQEDGDNVRIASTIYYFGERGAHNPTAMFMQQKNELEIIPNPHPREHTRYRAAEKWQFLIRFNGQPLTSHKVTLQTSNGSKSDWLTDDRGVVTVTIPDDVKEEEKSRSTNNHNHGRRSAALVLAAVHEANGKRYLSTFSSNYGPAAFDQRSVALGVGFTVIGMLGATPLLRQRKAVKKPSNICDAKES